MDEWLFEFVDDSRLDLINDDTHYEGLPLFGTKDVPYESEEGDRFEVPRGYMERYGPGLDEYDKKILSAVYRKAGSKRILKIDVDDLLDSLEVEQSERSVEAIRARLLKLSCVQIDYFLAEGNRLYRAPIRLIEDSFFGKSHTIGIDSVARSFLPSI